MSANEKRPVIEVTGLKKQYKLGQIGGGTLTHDLQSWWARVRGKEDPNTVIGTDQRLFGQTFMALNGVDLTVYQGEALGIIGRNGAGKSTLLKLLSRITAPTEGEIKIRGRVASMLEVGTGFNNEMTGRENIYMNGAILGMTRAEIDAKLPQIIEFSECGDFIDTPVKRYSSGMFVKLAFAVAAHLDSEIMVMDEVLAVGDMKFQQKCLGKMSDVAGQEGRTVLYVSHNMSTIRQLCTRCVVLDQGRVIFDGVTCEGKAALVLRGRSARVEGLVFANIRVPDKNGAGIRLERGDLTVTQSWFRDSEQGILTADDPSGTVTIDKSTFTRLGTCEGGGGCAHSIYIGHYGALNVSRSRFEAGRGGHYLKSRSPRVTVTDTSFDDSAGRGTNYMIDLPAGATGRITGNWFVQGTNKENHSAFIAVTAEDKENSSDGLVISGNDARFAPGVEWGSVFVADWSGDRLAIGENALGQGLRRYETR